MAAVQSASDRSERVPLWLPPIARRPPRVVYSSPPWRYRRTTSSGSPSSVSPRSRRARYGARLGASIRPTRGPAAGCTGRAMAERRGPSSPATVSLPAPWAESGWRWRAASMARGSTRWWGQTRARECTAPTTPVIAGGSPAATPGSRAGTGISAASPSIPRTPTSSTCRTWRCSAPPTAARRLRRSRALRAATTITSSGSILTHPRA